MINEHIVLVAKALQAATTQNPLRFNAEEYGEFYGDVMLDTSHTLVDLYKRNGKSVVATPTFLDDGDVIELRIRENVSYQVIHHWDVWGNKEDGWEVNNSAVHGKVTFPEDATNDEMILALKECGFLQRWVTAEYFNILDHGTSIDFDYAESGKPFCTLELKQETPNEIYTRREREQEQDAGFRENFCERGY